MTPADTRSAPRYAEAVVTWRPEIHVSANEVHFNADEDGEVVVVLDEHKVPGAGRLPQLYFRVRLDPRVFTADGGAEKAGGFEGRQAVVELGHYLVDGPPGDWEHDVDVREAIGPALAEAFALVRGALES